MTSNMSNTYSLKVIRADSVVWEAKFLRSVPDLYVKVTLDGVSRKTRTIKNTISPKWNETLTFPPSDGSSTFKIELKRNSTLGRNPCIGRIDIKLADLLVECVKGEVTFRLLPTSGASTTPAGTLALHLRAIDATTSVDINLKNAGEDVELRGLVRSTAISDSLANATNSSNQIATQSDLYQAIGGLLCQLEVFKDVLETVSKVHPFLTIAWQVTSVLYTSVTNVFKADERVVDLVRAMENAFAFARDAQALPDKVRSLQEPIVDLLKQTTECCLFVREYTRHGFAGRMLDMSSSMKIDEFEQSLAELKCRIDSGLNLHVAFVSVRISQGIDDLLLHQRLSPALTDGFHRPVCLPGTRVEVQRKIIEWLLSETKQNIFWLYGVAGSGKSTVSMTVAEYFRGLSRLGASMFFERGKSDPSAVIRTLAYKLASFDSSIGSRIHSEVERDKDIIASSSASQFSTLLFRPLKSVAAEITGPIVIVIDALDECGTPESRRNLMQLFRREFSRLPVNFRFLITSRSESDIDKALSSQPDFVCTMDLDYTSIASREDVFSYLRSEMHSVIQEQVEIPDDWPWDEQMALLGKAAGGLFIWASTAIKLVSNSDNPLYMMKRLVTDSTTLTRFGLDDLYATVLRHSGIAWSDERSKDRFAMVMSLLLFSKVPMSSKTMDAILGFPPEEPSTLILSRLQSLLRFVPGEPVSLFHASFSDYLMSADRSSDPWFIDISAQQHFISSRCFAVMEKILHFNICDLETSFVCNDDVKGLEERIKSNIPPHLEYACLYWAQHLREVPYSPELLDKLFTFTNRHLLSWFEVLSLLKAFGRVANFAIRETIAWLPTHDSDISRFLQDACGLATTFASSITHSTPHIYISMLPLTRDDSLVSAHYSIQTSSMVEVKRKGRKLPPRWTKVFEGHTDIVMSIALSPNCRHTGSWDCTIRLWDLNTGEAISSPFTGHSDRVRSVAFSPDGNGIISGSADKTVRVWNAQNGELIISPLEGHTDDVACVSYSPDGLAIVSSSFDATVRVWDAEDGRLLLGPLVGHSDRVYSVAYSPDGKLIVSGSRDCTICLWDAKTGHAFGGPFTGHTGTVVSVGFSPDGKHPVSVSMDGTIRTWDVESGAVVFMMAVGKGKVINSAMFSQDATRIAASYTNRTIDIWDMRSGSLISGPIEGHSGIIQCTLFLADDKSIVSCSDDKTIRLWDIDSGDKDSAPPTGHSGIIWAVAASSDGGRIVTGSEDKTVIVWNALSGEVIQGPLEGHTDFVRSVAFSTTGVLVASGSRDKTARVWDAASGMPVFGPLEGHSDRVTSVAFSPDDALIATGSPDKTIRLWGASNGELVVEPLVGHAGAINWVSFSPDGALLASASSDKTIRIWDARKGTFISELKGHTDVIFSVAFSPDGRRVVSGSNDTTVIVWEVKSGQIAAGPFEGHRVHVWSTIFSSDGKLVLSCGLDRTIKIRNVESGQLVCRPLVGHSDEVVSLAISSDGRRLFSASFDKTVRAWDLEKTLRPPLESGPSGNIGDLSDWELGENGWILGGPERSDLLLWIPPDLRPTLLSPQNTVIFSCPFSTELDFASAALGKRWSECFRSFNNGKESE